MLLQFYQLFRGIIIIHVQKRAFIPDTSNREFPPAFLKGNILLLPTGENGIEMQGVQYSFRYEMTAAFNTSIPNRLRIF